MNLLGTILVLVVEEVDIRVAAEGVINLTGVDTELLEILEGEQRENAATVEKKVCGKYSFCCHFAPPVSYISFVFFSKTPILSNLIPVV